MKRTFLMLAHEYDSQKHVVTSYYMSEKLDGIRAFWDGGICTGLGCADVPWANTTKHGRYLIPPMATGLWTRLGQPIQAPKWWLEKLPAVPLDGELTMGRETWQELSSCVKCLKPDDRWNNVRYMVFDSPPLATVFANGIVNVPGYKKEFRGITTWIEGRGEAGAIIPMAPFYQRNHDIQKWLDGNPIAQPLPQIQLPALGPQVGPALNKRLDEVEAMGGEGLILRSPISYWQAGRSYDLLKVKRLKDAEGVVVGYTWAKPTDMNKSVSGEKTDKLLGLMGSLRLRMDNGIEFDLSGFTNAEREMMVMWKTPDFEARQEALQIGKENPGQVVSTSVFNPKFPRGIKVTFQYRELSKDGIPKEARYHRVRPEGV